MRKIVTQTPDQAKALIAWAVTDGKAGTEAQALGLAEALGASVTIKRIRLRAPWRYLSPGVLRWGGGQALDPHGDRLDPPYPDLLIAAGRAAVLPSLTLGRRAGASCFRIQLQDPRISPRHFDLVIVPAHDRLRGTNVLTSLGALHGLTRAGLDAAAAAYGGPLPPGDGPLVAVLVGGNSKHHRIDAAVIDALLARLAHWAAQDQARFLVTVSRRTPEALRAILAARLQDLPALLWDGTPPNPYQAFLGLADAVIVTADSVTMASEAAATGRPVFIAAVRGHSAKFHRFHTDLMHRGIARPLGDRLQHWQYEPLQEAARLARMVRAQLSKS